LIPDCRAGIYPYALERLSAEIRIVMKEPSAAIRLDLAEVQDMELHAEDRRLHRGDEHSPLIESLPGVPPDIALTSATVYVVGFENHWQDRLLRLGDEIGVAMRTCVTAGDFLRQYRCSEGMPACLLLAVTTPGMTGLELQEQLCADGDDIPILFITESADVATVLHAMRMGAADFLVAPVDYGILAQQVRSSLELSIRQCLARRLKALSLERISRLSAREAEVFELLIQGMNNKQIARQLRITHPTVTKHRGSLLAKLCVSNTVELVRLSQLARTSPTSSVVQNVANFASQRVTGERLLQAGRQT